MRSTALVLLITLTVHAKDPPLPDAAKQMKREFTETAKKASKDYKLAIDKANAVYVEKLKNLQIELTKKGDLDGAIAVRDAIADAKRGTVPEAKPEPQKTGIVLKDGIVGLLWDPSNEPGSWGKPFVIRQDGTIDCPPGTKLDARWTPFTETSIFVIGKNGIVDYFPFDVKNQKLTVGCVGNTSAFSARWSATPKRK